MWGIPGTSPTKIKNPDHLFNFFGKDNGFWDISRIYAGGNLFDAREGGVGQVKILPGFAQPSFGAAGAVGWSMMGIDQFKGKEIPEGEKIEAFYRQMVPNIPGIGTAGGAIPDSYAQMKLRRSLSGKEGPTVDVHTPLSALAASVGLKIVPVDPKKLQGRSGMKLTAEIADIKKKISKSARDYQNGNMHSMLKRIYKTDEEVDKAAKKTMERRIESHVREIERLVRKYERDVKGK